MSRPIALLLCLTLPACAGYRERRAIMKQLADDEILLRAEYDQFEPGDTVVFLHEDCRPPTAPSLPPLCKTERLGTGTVERVVDHHHFLVKVGAGVSMKSVTRIEGADRVP